MRKVLPLIATVVCLIACSTKGREMPKETPEHHKATPTAPDATKGKENTTKTQEEHIRQPNRHKFDKRFHTKTGVIGVKVEKDAK